MADRLLEVLYPFLSMAKELYPPITKKTFDLFIPLPFLVSHHWIISHTDTTIYITNITTKVCVDDVEGLDAAIEGGADRIELCSCLALGKDKRKR